MHPEDGAGCLRCGFRKVPHRSPDLQAALLAASLARATADAHTSPAAPPLWPLRGWAIPQRNTSRLPAPHPAAAAHGGSREMPPSPVSWTSDRRLTRAGARQAHGRQHPRSVAAPSLTRRRSSLSLSQSAGVALFCVGYRTPDTSALQHHHQSAALPPASYQQRACVGAASVDRDSRPPRPQVDRREVRPHLCTPAQASVTTLSHPPHPPLQKNQAS